MSILDDAIREHLELKRAHGADDAELKRLEDEAFGPPARPDGPDPFAEAPTEFLGVPEAEAPPEEGSGRRIPNIADLQEAPPAPPEAEPPAAEAPSEAEPSTEAPSEVTDAPAAQEPPSPDPGAIADRGHSTEERHAIAAQPTEMFDVEGQFEDAATEAEAPSEEQLLDAELSEPRLAPVDPLAGLDDAAAGELEVSDQRDEEFEDEDDDFFSEQRLSDELNQALEQPLPDEPQLSTPPGATPPPSPPTEEPTAIFDIESEGDLREPDSAELEREDDSGEFAREEDSGEYEEADSGELERAGEEDSGEFATGEHEEAGPATGEHPAAASHGHHEEEEHEDVLEDTPDFLEDAPEDDNLWFEQKPPKDFDFDD
jgi:hypothetical protein